MGLHRTQQFILALLSESESLRYSDMHPVSMEPSQFMYHLRKLMSDELVCKQDDGTYALTAAGKRYIDRADDDSFSLRAQPRIGALIICEHPDKGLLYVRRDTHPARGMIGFPIIDLPLGFPLPLVGYARDMFKQMSGLDLDLAHRADGYVNVQRGDELEGSLLAHIFSAQLADKDYKLLSTHFNFCWQADLNEAERVLILSSNDYILKQLAANRASFFFFEQTIELEPQL